VPLGEARGGPEAESHDVYLALHPSQIEFANMLSERLQANGYRVYSNMWLFRQNSMRSYKADTSAWEKSTKPWRSAQAQHLSPTRPTATGARQEELLLRQCRHFRPPPFPFPFALAPYPFSPPSLSFFPTSLSLSLSLSHSLSLTLSLSFLWSVPFWPTLPVKAVAICILPFDMISPTPPVQNSNAQEKEI
jgi:hypothetical protein